MNQQEIKASILEKIRKGKPAAEPLPEVPMYQYQGDPLNDFIDHLLKFDGRAATFKTREDALAWLMAQPELDASRNVIYSSLEDVKGNLAESELAVLANAARINTCVTEGELGVGETGSIWVTDRSLKHAACALLSRRLFILLDADRICGGLHEAYAKVQPGQTQYGSFYSGPSATADIEAVHITGAQGPLVLTALIYNCQDAPDKPELRINPDGDKSKWAKAMEEDE